MIGSFFRVLFLAMLGLAGSWGAFLILPGLSLNTDRRDEVWYAAAFPSGFPLPARSRGAGGPTLPGAVLQGSPEAPRKTEILLARRLDVSKQLLPFWVVFLTMSCLAGALLRERLHLGTGYASPSVSFLAKRSGEAAILVFSLWSFAPLPLPYWIFYPALFLAMVAVLGYLANLPLRL